MPPEGALACFELVFLVSVLLLPKITTSCCTIEDPHFSKVSQSASLVCSYILQGNIWNIYSDKRAQQGWTRKCEQRTQEAEKQLAALRERSRRSAALRQQLYSRLQRQTHRSKAAAAAAQAKSCKRVVGLQATISKLQQEKAAAISDSNEAVNNLQAVIACLQQQVTALQETTAVASQAAAAAAAAAHATMEDEVAILMVKLASAEATIAATTAAELRANKALTGLQQQLQDVETDAATRVKGLEEDKAALEKRVGELEAGLAAREEDKAALEKRVGELEAGVAAREEDKAALEKRVGELEAGVAAREEDVMRLKEELNATAAADSAATSADVAAVAYAASANAISWLQEKNHKSSSIIRKQQLQQQEARDRRPRESSTSTTSNISTASSTTSSNTTTSSSSLNGSKCSWPSSSPHSSSSSKGVSQAGTKKAPGALTDAEAGADGALAGIVARKHHSSVYKPERLKGGGKPQVRQQGQAAGCLRRENALRGNGHCS
jgi:hypothetical protein